MSTVYALRLLLFVLIIAEPMAGLACLAVLELMLGLQGDGRPPRQP